jgi:cysteine protease ATG4
MEIARTVYNHLLDSMRGTNDSTEPIILLGKQYPSLSSPDFLADFRTRPWITYRSEFPPIRPSEYTSDMGWGCMLRSGQMLLANTGFLHHLGRDFRIGDKDTIEIYSKVDALLIL